MDQTTYIVISVITIGGICKSPLWRVSTRSRQKTKQAGQQGRLANKAGRMIRQLSLSALISAAY